MRTVRGAAAAVLAGFTAGCVSILPEPPPAAEIYPLRATVTPGDGPTAPLVLGVGRPNAVQALAVLDVVWMRDGRVAYLERATWAARMPEALQTLLAETISRQNLVAAAIRVGEGPRADYEIRWDIHAFQVEETPGRLEARFDASVRLMETGTRRVVASRPLSLSAPVPARTATAAVGALQALAAQGAAEIGLWAAQSAAATRAQAAP